jgi:N utilization substance protein A
MAKKKKAIKKAKKKAKKKAVPRKPKKQAKKAKPAPKLALKKSPKKKAAKKRLRGKADSAELVGYQRKGLGSFTGGQSGDIQGISGRANIDSESVTELLEEGQTFEAEAVSGVENAADPDVSEVVTHQVPEDDVPEEYQDKD